jgi:hypothetical protein
MADGLDLKFLLDENIPSRIWRVIQQHNKTQDDLIDAVKVGDMSDLPLSSDDAAILLWAEKYKRILITEDKRTMPVHLAKHLSSGHTCPGIFVLKLSVSASQIVEYLMLVAYSSQAREWQNRIEYIP